MTISPHHIAGGLLVSGLSVGGYFAVSALTPPTLENKLKDLGLTVLTSGWNTKEEEYKKSDEDLISSITKKNNTDAIPNFADNLKNWCNKRKTKNFRGDTDPNYKKFSRWCTQTITIDALLKSRKGLSPLDEQGLKEKIKVYKTNNETFIKSLTGEQELSSQDLTSWCTKQKEPNYKYESDSSFQQIIKWCYKN